MKGGGRLCGDGWQKITAEHLKDEHEKAKPMFCYKNGNKILATHQGHFNDHRKNY
jgi:hypothetical protein